MKQDVEVSIIIPFLNEAGTLKEVVIDCIHHFENQGIYFEIILIDDGSTDNSAKIALELSQQYNNIIFSHNKRNLGKGYSIRKAIYISKGKLIALIDSDGAHNPRDLLKSYRIIQRYPNAIVTGIRFNTQYHGTSKINLIGNRLYINLFHLLTGIRIRDINCGLRLMSKKTFLSINVTSSRYTIEAEVLAKAIKNNISIIELPILVKNRKYGKSKLNIIRAGLFIPITFILAYFGLFGLITRWISI